MSETEEIIRCCRCDCIAQPDDYTFGGRCVCDDCISPYEEGRLGDDYVRGQFYDRARSIIEGLLQIIRQEVYPAMNRIPDPDDNIIERAQYLVEDLRDDIRNGFVNSFESVPRRPRDPQEVRDNFVEMVDGINKSYEHNGRSSNDRMRTFHHGFSGVGDIKIPYPVGCIPFVKVAAMSSPFVVGQSWKRVEEEE